MSWIIIPIENSERSACSAESAGSNSDCEDGARPFAMLNSTVMHKQSSAKIWRRVISTLLRYGMTLQLSDEMKLSKSDESTQLQGDFPVRTSVVPAKVWESQENGAGFSSRLSGSFAWYDRESSSWKTYQRYLIGEWIEFSQSWPKAGMMLDGAVCRQPELERITKDSGGGVWPMPTQEMWPTPRAR